MKEILEKWLFTFGEISELQECMSDVLENCMFKGEKPYYALTLLNNIKEKTSKLYEEIDDVSIRMEDE